eukprot:771890-Alexandrium_andersonii.AAC.1
MPVAEHRIKQGRSRPTHTHAHGRFSAKRRPAVTPTESELRAEANRPSTRPARRPRPRRGKGHKGVTRGSRTIGRSERGRRDDATARR